MIYDYPFHTDNINCKTADLGDSMSFMCEGYFREYTVDESQK